MLSLLAQVPLRGWLGIGALALLMVALYRQVCKEEDELFPPRRHP